MNNKCNVNALIVVFLTMLLIIPFSELTIQKLQIDKMGFISGNISIVKTNITENTRQTSLLPIGDGESNFTLIALPDTQEYTKVGSSWNEIFYSETQWIVNNKDALNIVAVTGEGDIVSYATDAEYQVARTAYKKVEEANIPVLIPVGNHDYNATGPWSLTNYSRWFPVSNYSGKPYYGGHYGLDNSNSYILFSGGGLDFILLSLNYTYDYFSNGFKDETAHHTDALFTWANGILNTYSDRRAIVVTHCLLDAYGNWCEDGQSVYNALKGNPNLFLMLCGHMFSHGPPYDGEAMRTETFNGHTIYVLLADYQSMQPYGGNGTLRIMTFIPSLNQIQVKTYRPGCTNPNIAAGYETDEDSQFTLPYNMTYTLTIDSVGNGVVTPTSGLTYFAGTIVSIEATPDEGWSFKRWDGDLTGTTNPTSITMNENKHVIANFTQIPDTYPNTPTNPIPANGTINISINIQLNWTGGDQDAGDTVTYDVYFGTINPPTTIVSSNQSLTTYTPGPIMYNKQYYWKIVAWDSHGNSTKSSIWEFTTENTPPDTPSNLYPLNNATNIPLNAFLSWAGEDPDRDTVTYDIYFGTTNPPPKFQSNLSETSYNPGMMKYLTTYYWKIIAWDNHSTNNASPIWCFTTKSSSGGGGTSPSEPENQKPIAKVSAGESYQGLINTPILFDGLRSYDPDGTITTWVWNFGDNTNGTGKIITHSYSKEGTYAITLTVTDNEGATSTDTTTCMVSKPNNSSPSNPIITGPTNCTINTSYNFTVISTDADNDSLSYSIRWGDVTSYVNWSNFLPSGTPYTFNHRWATSGQYTLTVTVTDNQTESSSRIVIDVHVEKKAQPSTPGFEIIIIIGALAFVLFWKRKRIIDY